MYPIVLWSGNRHYHNPKQIVILKTVLGALRYDGDTDSISRDREVVIFINISPIIYWDQPLSAPAATGVGGGGGGRPLLPSLTDPGCIVVVSNLIKNTP